MANYDLKKHGIGPWYQDHSGNIIAGEPGDKSVQVRARTLQDTKVDEILSHTHFELGATGVRLSEEHDEIFPEHHELDKVTLAPTGSDLTDKKEEIPAVVPDTSHLSIKPD